MKIEETQTFAQFIKSQEYLNLKSKDIDELKNAVDKLRSIVASVGNKDVKFICTSAHGFICIKLRICPDDLSWVSFTIHSHDIHKTCYLTNGDRINNPTLVGLVVLYPVALQIYELIRGRPDYWIQDLAGLSGCISM